MSMAKLDKEHSNLLSHTEGQWLRPSHGPVEKHQFAWGEKQAEAIAWAILHGKVCCRLAPRGSLHGTRIPSHLASIFRSFPQTSVVYQQTHQQVPSCVLPKSLQVASPSDIAHQLMSICITGLPSFRTKRITHRLPHAPPTGGISLPSPPTSRVPSKWGWPWLTVKNLP